MTSNESLKTFRAVIEMSAYNFDEAAEEIRRDGYALKSLTELPAGGSE